MSLDSLLNSWVRQRKDVTFPVDWRDAHNLSPSFVPFGFSNDGRVFTTIWEMEFNEISRITAAFTGVIYINQDGGVYSLLLRLFTSAPLNTIIELPDWYPLPAYAKYSTSLSSDDIRNVVINLLTEDESRIQATLGSVPVEAADARAIENRNRFLTMKRNYERITLLSEATIDQIVQAILDDTYDEGIPVSAGTILFSASSITFSLHSMHVEGDNAGDIDETLFFNPNFYFRKWTRDNNPVDSDREGDIEHLSDFPTVLFNQVIGPPMTTGRVLYVKQIPDSDFTNLYTTIQEAYINSDPNDTILILDNGTYSFRGINTFISILALKSANDHIRRFAEENDIALRDSVALNYPTITSTSGSRGLAVIYQNGIPPEYGLIYLSNISISNNILNVSEEILLSQIGGAGILILGSYYNSSTEIEPIGYDFSQVHIENCAIIQNRMEGFPSRDRVPIGFGGGGILCYFSSPLIKNCLIKENTGYFHGGGIGIIKYGWPVILNNTISKNRSIGHPYGDLDGGDIPGGNGDGGGIGVFLAYPEHRRTIQPLIGEWEAVSGAIRTLLPRAWDVSRLQQARDKWIKVSNNDINSNYAEMSGGGVYGTVCANIALFNNNIQDNSATQQDGGGIAITYGSRMASNRDVVTDNRSGRSGGGIYIRSSKARISDSRIQENIVTDTTSGKGGGIHLNSSPEILTERQPQYDVTLTLIFDHIDEVKLELQNSTINNNTATLGGGLFVNKNEDLYETEPRWSGLMLGIIRIHDVHLIIDNIRLIHDNRLGDIESQKILTNSTITGVIHTGSSAIDQTI